MEEQRPHKKIFTPHQVKLKAEAYCAYQERSQQEVRDKLYEWGLHLENVEQIISELIATNFLNEERFANAFVLGKFRIKGWGKIKIQQHLKAKRVSPPLIKAALQQIDLDDYEQKLTTIIEKKINGDVQQLTIQDKAKLIRYLQSKGYENALIFEKIRV
ncbi:regulatory protein RecX [Sphingobacterium faecale]|uniref:Regulatory protein RecX n=1 Tax=Sphingobacterium faecale TaxID=2803775 RepID=A0ABS1R2G2_9SPHI|nr:regulatory protein RecX [Sphingobacterium faecale]MBL1408630.1 RecX family transcriptional regulator [Sphingobacterium faecale]